MYSLILIFGLINIVSAYTYDGYKINCNTPYTYYFDSSFCDLNFNPLLTLFDKCDKAKAVTRDAMNVWEKYIPCRFSEVYTTDADLIIRSGNALEDMLNIAYFDNEGYINIDNNTCWYMTNQIGSVMLSPIYMALLLTVIMMMTVSYTGFTVYSFLANKDKKIICYMLPFVLYILIWYSITQSSYFNCYSLSIVMAHELGHSLGMGHSTEQAIMQSIYQPSISDVCIYSDDIYGIISLYGNSTIYDGNDYCINPGIYSGLYEGLLLALNGFAAGLLVNIVYFVLKYKKIC